MSFVSRSGTAGRLKEFILAGDASASLRNTGFEELKDVKSTRFERKNQYRKNRRADGGEIAPYRSARREDVLCNPVLLGNVKFDHIRSFQNLEAYPHVFESDIDVLQWLCAMTGESPTVRLLLKEAQDDGWSITLDDLSQDGYAVDAETQSILIDHYGMAAPAIGKSAHFRHAMLVNFIKALRQLWHDRRSTNMYASHRPDALIQLERARAADCETVAILAGWELRAAGHSDFWRYLIGSPIGDMAIAFTQKNETDPTGFYDGSVLTRTFCEWYADEARVGATDTATLEYMDELMDGAKGKPVFGKNSLTPAAVERLSALPRDRAYLEGMGGNICVDPHFVRVRDTINEAHLSQIIYDIQVVRVEGVPFRDPRLARLIFPENKVKVTE